MVHPSQALTAAEPRSHRISLTRPGPRLRFYSRRRPHVVPPVRASVEDEGDLQVDAEGGHVPAVDHDLLLLDPCRLHVPDRLARLRDAFPDGVVEALGRIG